MKNTRSPLVRTLIQDKNGVLTTRLMRQDDPASSLRYDLAPKLPPLPSLPSDGDPTEQFHALIFGPNISEFEKKLTNVLKEDDPETIPLAVKLLTTGSEVGQQWVRRTIEDSFQDIGNALAESSNAYAEDSDDWAKQCDTSWSPYIKNTMSRVWNAGNVIEETGCETNPIDIHYRAYSFNMKLDFKTADEDRSKQNDYWRGLAIAGIADLKLLGENWKKLREFASWAGQHEDPKRVVELVVERESLDVELLTLLMDEQDKKHSSIANGAL